MSRVLIAGGSGVLGRAAIPHLEAAGHEVVVMSRRPPEGGIAADALEPDQVRRAQEEVRPDVVVNALTALPPAGPRKESDVDATNRLRIEGTDNLIAAGARRLISESFLLVGIEGPIGDALRHLEERTLAVDGIVLRFGLFYGLPGPTPRFPLPAGAPSLFSFVHIDDAGSAIAAAVDRGEPGTVYDVADDEPMTFGDHWRARAAAAGHPRPRNIPLWAAKLVAPFAARFAAEMHLPLDNSKLRAIGWEPRAGR